MDFLYFDYQATNWLAWKLPKLKIPIKIDEMKAGNEIQ